jgi:hypothetical protein
VTPPLFPVMRSTHEQANFRQFSMAAEDRRAVLWRYSFTRPRASSLDSDRPQPNKRLSRLELVERHDHTRSRAITRQGSARQPIRAACPPSAAVWGDAKLVHPLFMKILFALPQHTA